MHSACYGNRVPTRRLSSVGIVAITSNKNFLLLNLLKMLPQIDDDRQHFDIIRKI